MRQIGWIGSKRGGVQDAPNEQDLGLGIISQTIWRVPVFRDHC